MTGRGAAGPSRLVEAIRGPAVAVDPECHRVVAANDAALRSLGADRPDVLDRPVGSLLDSVGDDIGSVLDRTVDADETAETTVTPAGSGTGRPAAATVAPVGLSGGSWVSVTWTVPDAPSGGPPAPTGTATDAGRDAEGLSGIDGVGPPGDDRGRSPQPADDRDRRLFALAGSLSDVLSADSAERVAVEATGLVATAVPDPVVGYWEYDEAEWALRPVDVDARTREAAADLGTDLVFGEGSAAMDLFEGRRDRSAGDPPPLWFPVEASSLLAEPVGHHGLLVAGSVGEALSPADEDLLATVAAGAAATLDRIDRIAELSLLNEAVERSSVAVSIVDATAPGNPVVYCNDYFEELTGYSESELLGHSPTLLRGPETDPEREAEIQAAIEEGVSVSREVLHYRSDGTRFWNQVDIVPITDDAGEPTHVLRFQRDVTDRVRRRQQSAVLNRVLRHNLRNDLGAILGYAERLESHLGPDDQAREFLDVIAEKAADLVTLADKVRSGLEDIETGDPDRVRLGSLLTDLAVEFRGEYPEADVGLSFVGGQDRYVDRTLGIAVREAVENAIEHNDGPEPTVRLVVETAGDGGVRVRVVDDGDGIPQMERKVFRREAEETPLAHGSGIGLWLVAWTVTTLGGRVDVEDGDAGGTELTIEVPAAGSAPEVEDSQVPRGDPANDCGSGP
jgi:PAS domain S-box-containing protein